MIGRKTKLTSDVSDAICYGVKIGLPYARAAARAGITRRTFYYWQERGEAERERLQEKGARSRKRETPFLHFLHSLEAAHAEAQHLLVGKIQRAAADGKWQAALAILERRYPDEWGRQDRLDVTSKGEQVGAGEQSDTAILAAEGLVALYDSLAARGVAPELPGADHRSVDTAPGTAE